VSERQLGETRRPKNDARTQQLKILLNAEFCDLYMRRVTGMAVS